MSTLSPADKELDISETVVNEGEDVQPSNPVACKYHNKLFLLPDESIPEDNSTSIENVGLSSITEKDIKSVENVESGKANGDIAFRSDSNTLQMENSLIDPSKDVKKQISLVWDNINVSVKVRPNPIKLLASKCLKKEVIGVTEIPILRRVSGSVNPGNLLAILGSSGAGKTTFLNFLTHKALSVRTFKVAGEVFINGENCSRFELAQISAYVQQEDIFIGTITVKEHLIFNALLRMGNKFSYKEKLERVKQVIHVMGLNKCKNNTIGLPGYTKAISGGEKKRLSFATELLNNPMLLLADEPTSGLDSYLASTVVGCLKTLAKYGRTIMCTIHQPSSEVFSHFTHVMILSQGRVAYLGEREGMVAYFSKLNFMCPKNYNPADYVINILSVIPGKENVCKERIETVCNQHSLQYQHTESKSVTNNVNNSRPWYKPMKFTAPFWTQFLVVFWRELRATLRNKPLIVVRFLQQFFQGLLFGIVYWQIPDTYARIQNVAGLLFLSIIGQSIGNVMAVVHTFPGQLPVFWKEYFSGMYRIWVYFLTKTLAELPFFIFLPIFFALVVYFFAGLSVDAGKFFIFYFILVLAGNASLSLGYFISTVSPTIAIALAIAPLLIIPFMIFGGLFAQSGSLLSWLTWIEYISWFKYGFEGLMVNEWVGYKFSNDTINACLNSTMNACFKTGEDVLGFYNLNADNFWLDVGAIFVILIVLRVIAFVALMIHTLIRAYV
ncbi:Protein white [Oopsacas minuta]|uniref:Protein white n=1 Tax=Oopsacas minuta TaxID=111878 RepID=A0AAV7JW70_9METZ|nr:Protein white [Oopsacas minuta]